MTLQHFATIFNLTGISLVLFISWWVQRRYSMPFFRHWTSAYFAMLLLIVAEYIGPEIGRPVYWAPLEVFLIIHSAWKFEHTTQSLKERPLSGKYYWLIQALFCSLTMGMLVAGINFTSTVALPLIIYSIALFRLGLLLMRVTFRSDWFWVGVPMIFSSLMPVLYIFIAGTPV